MKQAINRWAVELNGSEADREAWRMLLKPPFDPFIEEIKDQRGGYLALRSSAFDGIATSAEVHQAAKQLVATLNVTFSILWDTDLVTDGAIVEFVPGGAARRHQYLEVGVGSFRLRGGPVQFSAMDSQGNVIELPPTPSRAQLWMRAAALAPEIGSALRYLRGSPGWVELYKAYEALQGRPNRGISKNEEERFRRIANAKERHHQNNKHNPHKHPMELWEARALVTRWVSAAIDDILARNP